jgi:hypothetical protein
MKALLSSLLRQRARSHLCLEKCLPGRNAFATFASLEPRIETRSRGNWDEFARASEAFLQKKLDSRVTKTKLLELLIDCVQHAGKIESGPMAGRLLDHASENDSAWRPTAEMMHMVRIEGHTFLVISSNSYLTNRFGSSRYRRLKHGCTVDTPADSTRRNKSCGEC